MKDITTRLSMVNQFRVINRKKFRFAQICSKEKNLGISVLSNCTSAIELTPVFEAEDRKEHSCNKMPYRKSILFC